MATETFPAWLQEELNNRSWSQADLARQSGLKTATISRIMSGERKAGIEACNAIAHAFHVPPTVIYRAAGLLPPEPEYVPLLDEWNAVFYELDEDERQELLDIARLKVSRHKSGKTPPKTSSRIKKTPARSANVQK